ncbi:aldo/keto reductase family oxidoreductase [Maribacter sp. R77961]|uniref:aldo/keto reductase family oxidoreductase n=1 Tax=Maribacter sp. R77961 TaxID=3093871 RepID=UPI0037C90547
MKQITKYSRIIAGTMTWGNWGKQLATDQMIALMNSCLELNITTFDHADIYGDYTTEEQFGTAFNKSAISREEIQLITKCGIQFDAKARSNRVKHYNYDKDYIVWSAERSLKLLKSEYLDVLLLHRPSPLMQPSEIAEAIMQLKKDGKIRQFGVSNFTPSQIALLETVLPVEGNQVEYSLTTNEVMNNGILNDCLSNKRMAMSWSPLGAYFREETEQTKRIRKILNNLCEKYEASEDQLLLSWVLKHPSKIHPVVGTATPERLALAMKAVEIDLELEDWFLLLEASNGNEVA